jgi:glycosyltransferase involved in cell wall biosynthesis
MRIAMLSTYPPTQCGIATFARSLSDAVSMTGPEVNIVKVGGTDYPDGNPVVLNEHRGLHDLPRTLQTLNDHDVVVVQHEFGIYGGEDGADILDIVGGISAPIISILHTVVEQPSPRQHRIIQGLLNASDSVVTLSKSALRTLLRSHEVDMNRVRVIPHGAPRLGKIERPPGMRLRPRILTWGLLGDGKGIEWGIEALARLRDIDPAPDYFVVGQTHPKVVQRDGYRYRNELAAHARRLGVQDRVFFVDGYLDASSLARLVTSADIFLLPYDTRDQVTSGVLAEAMVAGGPVVATRFPHAVELLGDGTGILVEHQSPSSIAGALRRLIRQPQLRSRMRELTRQKAASFHWSSVGLSFSQLAHGLHHGRQNGNRRAAFQPIPVEEVSIPA